MARILIGNVKGPIGATGPVGPRGPEGPQGIQGPLCPLTNNALATVPGVAALDAVMGKTLSDKDTALQNEVTKLNSELNFSEVFKLSIKAEPALNTTFASSISDMLNYEVRIFSFVNISDNTTGVASGWCIAIRNLYLNNEVYLLTFGFGGVGTMSITRQ